VFKVAGGEGEIRVFTTRPDTLYGATYMVLSPEHPLVDKITTPAQRRIVSELLLQVCAHGSLVLDYQDRPSIHGRRGY